jgi:hypothetical protein
MGQFKLLQHLSEHSMLSDEQIIEKSTVQNIVDCEYALTLFAEREFSKITVDNIINELFKITIT